MVILIKIKDMITEDYCSFELSKLLKEKGFEQHKTKLAYDKKGKLRWSDNLDPFEFSAPTHQIVMKWLRAQGIRICIDYNNMSGDWYATIAKEYDGQISERIRSEHFTLYEEAVEAALKYVLENLI